MPAASPARTPAFEQRLGEDDADGACAGFARRGIEQGVNGMATPVVFGAAAFDAQVAVGHRHTGKGADA